jgi:hypothetical protein
MNNQQLMDQGNQLMDETDQAIARSKQVSLMLWKCLCTPYTPRFWHHQGHLLILC